MAKSDRAIFTLGSRLSRYLVDDPIKMLINHSHFSWPSQLCSCLTRLGRDGLGLHLQSPLPCHYHDHSLIHWRVNIFKFVWRVNIFRFVWRVFPWELEEEYWREKNWEFTVGELEIIKEDGELVDVWVTFQKLIHIYKVFFPSLPNGSRKWLTKDPLATALKRAIGQRHFRGSWPNGV